MYKSNSRKTENIFKPQFVFFISLFVVGFFLPSMGLVGKIIGVVILVVSILMLLEGVLSSRGWRYYHFILIGFLCGSEIFFRDFVLKGLAGYLAVEYILIVVAILNLPLLWRSLPYAREKNILIFWFIFCGWVLTTLIFSQDIVAGRWFVSLYLSGLAILSFFVIVAIPHREKVLTPVMQGIVLGSLLVLGTALQYYLDTPQSFLVLTQYRFAQALCSSNQIAITLAAGILAALVEVLASGKRHYIILILFLFAGLIATFSRGVIVATLLSILIIFFFSKEVKSKSVIIILIVLLFPVIFYVSNKLPETFNSRYQNIVIDNERIGIWTTGFNAWKSKPIGGYGIGNWATTYSSYAPNYSFNDAPSYISDAHNILLQILVETGIVGALLFVFFIIALTKESIKRNSPIAFALLAFVLIVGSVENWKMSVLFLLLGLIILTPNIQNNKRVIRLR